MPNDLSDDISESEISSLLNDKIIAELAKKPAANSKLHYTITSIHSFEISNLKNASLGFFVAFILSIAIIISKYIPNIYKTNVSIIDISEGKSSFKYFSYFIGATSSTEKIILTVSQVIYLFLSVCLFNLLNQRMSVPEYQENKYLTTLAAFSSGISSFTFLILVFNPQYVLNFSKTIGSVDNCLFTIFMLSTIFACLFSYLSISTISSEGGVIFRLKEICIGILMITFIGYLLSLIIVNIFTPGTTNEKIMISVLIMLMGVNNIFFLLTFAIFVLSFRYDVELVYKMLNAQPDVEYFIDNNSANSIDIETP